MATRILIICKSHEVPGPDKDKAMLLANKGCQKLWARDFDEAQGDRLTMEGEFTYGVRCSLLIDNGPLDATGYTTTWFKWKEQDLVHMPGPLHPYILKQFRERFQFNPADRPKPIEYTDEEFKEEFGFEKYKELMKAKTEREEIARRFGSSSS